MSEFTPGAIVQCRGREWVIASVTDDLLHLRPLVGHEAESFAIFRPLVHLEDLLSASFPPPEEKDLGNFIRARLLAEAARLSLRYGVTSLQAAGKLNFEPRPYQLVPLIMALRLDPVRLLIADDVGVGKTIEAALILKELIERGEVSRFIVLCPPYLADQWAHELREKFSLPTEVVSPKTMARLERKATGEVTIFRYYPYLVASIDYLKGERWRSIFLKDAPELVVVDEVHTCARPPQAGSRDQHLRYELVKTLAEASNRHLILLTATPHSGIEESFRSLLGLLKPEFETLNLDGLDKDERRRERERLARHFIQRTREHVKEWLGTDTPFPERESFDLPYTLSPAYRDLFREVYEFAHELVETVKREDVPYRRRRLRFWAALALLRSLMSSPASAVAAFEARLKRRTANGEQGTENSLNHSPLATRHSLDEEETLLSPLIYDPITKEVADDTNPQAVIEHQLKAEEETFQFREIRRLREFLKKAQKLSYAEDTKFKKVASEVNSLLEEGFSPVIYCRYITTAEYVAKGLQEELEKVFPDLGVSAITGRITEDERRLKVEELSHYPKRVLVATDCLSEGINLQEHFNAVIHYDLPWNPNRLEQREGRVDRFGQAHPVVKTYLVYGQDNPVDGAVLEVLLRKAKEIHKSLGILVPLPQDHAKVMEALVESLFLRGEDRLRQRSLFEEPTIDQVTRLWDEAANREKKCRTIFAQRAIKLQEEVARELVEVAERLGTQKDVERFVLEAVAALEGDLRKVKEGLYRLYLNTLPREIRARAGLEDDRLKISFHFPPPEGAIFIGRNHPLVEALASYILGQALSASHSSLTTRYSPVASRAAVIRTEVVSKRTVLCLLRVRYQARNKLIEELVTLGFCKGRIANGERGIENSSHHSPFATRYSLFEAGKLLYGAEASGDILPEQKRDMFLRAKEEFESMRSSLEDLLNQRAQEVEENINRLRRAGERRMKVKFVPLADLLGLYVLLPKPRT